MSTNPDEVMDRHLDEMDEDSLEKSTLTSSQKALVNSMRAQWVMHRKLSDRQVEILCDIHTQFNSHTKRAGGFGARRYEGFSK